MPEGQEQLLSGVAHKKIGDVPKTPLHDQPKSTQSYFKTEAPSVDITQALKPLPATETSGNPNKKPSFFEAFTHRANVSDFLTENPEISLEQLQRLRYVSPEELAQAARGAEDYKDLYNASSLLIRNFLKHNPDGELVQTMFLGLRAGFMPTSENTIRILTQIKFPLYIHRVGNFFYDERLVRKTMTENPDIYQDFSEGQAIYSYIKQLISKDFEYKPNETEKMRALRDEYWEIRQQGGSLDDLNIRIREEQERYTHENASDNKKFGLLLGYPKRDVIAFSDHENITEALRKFLENESMYTYLPNIRYSDEELTILRMLLRVDENGKAVNKKGGSTITEELVDKFIESHEEEVKRFLEKSKSRIAVYMSGQQVTEDDINYILSVRSGKARGFRYTHVKDSLQPETFPQKVEELYEESGMYKIAGVK